MQKYYFIDLYSNIVQTKKGCLLKIRQSFLLVVDPGEILLKFYFLFQIYFFVVLVIEMIFKKR